MTVALPSPRDSNHPFEFLAVALSEQSQTTSPPSPLRAKLRLGFGLFTLLIGSVSGYWCAAQFLDAGWSLPTSPESEVLLEARIDENWDSQDHWKPVREEFEDDEGSDFDEDRPGPDQPPAPPIKPVPSPSREPSEQLREYYSLISRDQFRQAYDMRSRSSHAKTSYGQFQKTWTDNVSIAVKELNTSKKSRNRAVVKGRVLFKDKDRDGVAEERPYLVRVNMVEEGGRWRYDGGDFELELNPYRIDPGRGVGYLRLGRPLSSKALGAYGPSKLSPPGSSMDSGSRYWEGQLLAKLNDGRARDNVYSIFVQDSRFFTLRGVKIGTSEADLLRAYPTVRRSDDSMDGDYVYKGNGISFTINSRRVSQVFVKS